MLVDHQHTIRSRRRHRVRTQRGNPALVYCRGIPGGLREEPLQALRLGMLRTNDWFSVGKGGQGLVALGRQQETFQVAAKAITLIPSRKEGIERVAVRFQGTRGGRNGEALSHNCISSPVVLPLLLLQHTTNTCATERLGKGMLCYSAPPFNTRLLQMQARTNDERHDNRYCGQDHGDKL